MSICFLHVIITGFITINIGSSNCEIQTQHYSRLTFQNALSQRHTTIHQKNVSFSDRISVNGFSSKLQCSNYCSKTENCQFYYSERGSCISFEYEANEASHGFTLSDSHFVYLKTNQARDCGDWYNRGFRSDGIYSIDPDGQGSFSVYCELNAERTDGSAEGGWTVMQRRLDGSVDFYRYWADYEEGFGDITGNYWMGLNKIHRLTTSAQTELLVYLEDFNNEWRYAKYTNFKIGNSSDLFRIYISGYTGSAGDSLSAHDGLPFTTRDRENTPVTSAYYPCGETCRGAWWYGTCYFSNLNGEYLGGGYTVYAGGIDWFHWRGYYYSLKTSVMKIRIR